MSRFALDVHVKVPFVKDVVDIYPPLHLYARRGHQQDPQAL